MAFGIAEAISLGGSLLGMAGDIFGAKEKSEQAEVNKRLLRKEIKYQKWKMGVELKRLSDYTAKLLGTQKVTFTKSGIDPFTGTAKGVLSETILQSQLDAQIIRQEAKINIARARAGIEYFEDVGSTTTTLGYLGAASTLLTEAGRWQLWGLA